MEIKYEIKGIVLNYNELHEIHHYYEAACTAEYLLENYYDKVTEETAMRIAYDVREKMRDCDMSEEEAIDKILEKLDVIEDDNCLSATDGDYSPTHPWDAPGMSESDFL